MGKIPQTIRPLPGGKAMRLMARAKSRRYRVKHKRWINSAWGFRSDWNGAMGYGILPDTGCYREVMVRPDGVYRGTKKVPVKNAKKNKKSGARYTRHILIQDGINIVSAPPDKIEFYWQEGTLKSGRFKPLQTPQEKKAKS